LKENSLEKMRGETLDLKRGRVISEERERYAVEFEGQVVPAVLSGKLRHQSIQRSDLPTVGDFVLLRWCSSEGVGRIEEVEARKTKLVRKLAGENAGEQLLGANIDTVFLLNSLNRDLNLRRIERYLVMIRDGGIRPVVVLTKADLVSTQEVLNYKQAVMRISGEDSVICTSVEEPLSFEPLIDFLRPGETVALLGSSGVGKSTMTNLILGQEKQVIQEIGAHAERGKHTTTSRSLFRLQSGAYLIDTPGIREIQLWSGEGGVEDSFHDVLTLMSRCRFRNCRHGDDLGCAVRKAINSGELEEKRFYSLLKIQREQAFMKQREKAKTSNHHKHIWKNRSREYRRGKRR
jgi:ribosome biogenesis GTPase